MPLENIMRIPLFADWGGLECLFGIVPDVDCVYYSPSQEFCAQLMDNLCADDSCDFVVSVGDNFYERGVKSIGMLPQLVVYTG